MSDESKKIEMGGHVAYMGDRGEYRVLVEKLKGQRPLGKARHRRKENIKMGIQ